MTEDLQEMEKLIADLLESERMNQGHSVLSKTPTNLKDLVDEVCEDLGATNAINAVDDIPHVAIDRTRIRLLLRNLIGNSLTHGGPSPPTIAATRGSAANSASGATMDTLKISVADSGTGVDPTHIDHLTEPFYRTDESRTRSTGGFGLGLYLCKLIAEAHGGKIFIDSVRGQGTTVSVLIPVDSALS